MDRIMTENESRYYWKIEIMATLWSAVAGDDIEVEETRYYSTNIEWYTAVGYALQSLEEGYCGESFFVGQVSVDHDEITNAQMKRARRESAVPLQIKEFRAKLVEATSEYNRPSNQ